MLQKRDERIETHLYVQIKYREVQAQFTQLRNSTVSEQSLLYIQRCQ
jgi:hypothetical protein